MPVGGDDPAGDPYVPLDQAGPLPQKDDERYTSAPGSSNIPPPNHPPPTHPPMNRGPPAGVRNYLHRIITVWLGGLGGGGGNKTS